MLIDKLAGMKIVILGFGVTGEDVLKTLDDSYDITIIDDNISPERKLGLKEQGIDALTTIEAINNGLEIDVIIKSPGISYSNQVLVDYVDALVINDIELAYLITRNTNTKIIAITGTNGKTTTTTFITCLLNNLGYNAFSCGNIGVSPLRVLHDQPEVDYLVMELSSFQLKAINEFTPDYAFFLNFTPDHLDYHESMDDYLTSKLNIFKNCTDQQYIFIDKNLTDFVIGKKYYDNDIHISSELYDSINGIYKNNIKLIYRFCQILGIKDQILFDTLTNKFKPLPHRIEFVKEINGVKYINDSKATNVEASRVALSQFENIILLVGGYDKGEDISELKPFLKNVKYLISYGANKNQFDNLIKNYQSVENLEEALSLSNVLANHGDVVLLSPASASYDQFKNFEQRGEYFRRLVEKI